MKGIYYILNYIGERGTSISGYFPTEDEAREGLKNVQIGFVRMVLVKFGFKNLGLMVRKH